MIGRVGVEKEVMLIGGVAKNIGVVTRIERELVVKAVEMKPDSQIVGALGAALFAWDLWLKSRSAK